MTGSYPRLVDTDEGCTIEYKNRLLYSARNPSERPKAAANAADVSGETLVLVPSPLLFYGLEILSTKLSPTCFILCVETDQQLMRVTLDNAPDTYLHGSRIAVLRADGPAGVISYLESLGLWRFRRVKQVILNGGYALDRETYDEIHQAVDLHIRKYWQNRMTLIHLGRLWIRNILCNLARYAEDLDRPLPTTEKPILVAGAGESLEESLPRIEELRDHLHFRSRPD